MVLLHTLQPPRKRGRPQCLSCPPPPCLPGAHESTVHLLCHIALPSHRNPQPCATQKTPPSTAKARVTEPWSSSLCPSAASWNRMMTSSNAGSPSPSSTLFFSLNRVSTCTISHPAPYLHQPNMLNMRHGTRRLRIARCLCLASARFFRMASARVGGRGGNLTSIRVWDEWMGGMRVVTAGCDG